MVAGLAHAADLTVRVVDRAGQPVQDAVVTFSPEGGAPGPIRFEWAYRVSQQDTAFHPYVLIVPVGAEVAFPNLDRVRHHVYSFSPGNRFELRLYGRDESRAFRFTTAGVAAIGCNIHDQMSAYILVVDTPFAAKTNASGEVLLRGAAGAGELRVWHPALRAPGNRVARAYTAPAAGAARESFSIDLRATAAGPR